MNSAPWNIVEVRARRRFGKRLLMTIIRNYLEERGIQVKRELDLTLVTVELEIESLKAEVKALADKSTAASFCGIDKRTKERTKRSLSAIVRQTPNVGRPGCAERIILC